MRLEEKRKVDLAITVMFRFAALGFIGPQTTGKKSQCQQNTGAKQITYRNISDECVVLKPQCSILPPSSLPRGSVVSHCASCY